MKNQPLLRSSVLMLALFSVFFFSCGKANNETHIEEPYKLETNLFVGNQLFIKTMKARNSENVFEILQVVRKNDMLDVTVKGGGAAASFQFIWDGLVQESFPMGVQLIMLYENTNKDFDRNKEISVSVNLQKIVGERNNVNDYHFNVINGSKKQTVILNPDGSTSKEDK
uniref:Lipoprotein n=1 Tax=Sphingobacterium sp. (strain 21) TaxID=743722 RepID=F4CC97_SPHS2